MYSAAGKADNQHALIEQHASLVKRIAHHLMGRLPSSVQLDDLIQAGMIGLLEAARNFDQTKGASFTTFAGIRIRGSMLDEVRRGDWIPRSVHRNSRRISEAIRALEVSLRRDPTDVEIAQALEISIDEYHGLLQDTKGSKLFSLDELVDEHGQEALGEPGAHSEDHQTPAKKVERGQMHDHLVAAMKSLPEREQLVMALYYDEELNLKEIGAILGVSESRVSQIHSQGAARLRTKLTEWQR